MRAWGGIDELRVEGEKLANALAREAYEVRAGLADAPGLVAIYDRFAWIPRAETFAAVEAERARAVVPEQGQALGRLAEWVAAIIEESAGRELAERITTTEAASSSVVRGERIGHHDLLARVTNAADRSLRAELYEALEAHWRSLSPLYADMLASGREAVRGLGRGEYVPAKSALAGFDFAAVAADAETFLSRTDDLYRDALGELAQRRSVGVPTRQLELHDVWSLLRLPDLDGMFHGADMAVRCLGAIERMGLDPRAAGRVRFDLDARPGKSPRAFCVGLHVPREIVIVCKPRGGAADYRTFLHELGHGLHMANTSSALPFEDRVLGDASVTEGWATVLERMCSSRSFLERVLHVARRATEIPARELATADLFVARRHAARLTVEIDHAAGVPGASERYADALSRASGVRLGDSRWAVDIDPGLYSARYLRAWQFQALAFEVLRERFDEDWFVNPKTGPYLAGWWSLGQSENADELAQDAFGATLNVERLVQRFEERLS